MKVLKEKYDPRYGQYGLAFTKEEFELVQKALKAYVPTLNKKIKLIEDNPNNYGQATYACQIDEVRGLIKFVREVEALKIHFVYND